MKISMLSVLVSLLVPQVVAADSFFDIFTDLDSKPGQTSNLNSAQTSMDIDFSSIGAADVITDYSYDITIPPIPECNACDVLKAELDKKLNELNELRKEQFDAQMQWMAHAHDQSRLVGELAEKKRQLSELTNSKSWAESDGVRRDSADLRVMEQYNSELWDQYQNGDLGADEYQQKLREGLTDEQRENRKQQLIKALQKEVEALERSVRLGVQLTEAMHQIVKEITAEIDALSKVVLDLVKKLEDCVKKCQEKDVNIVADYGMGQSAGGGIWDWITGGDSEDPEDTPVDQLPTPLEPLPFVPMPPIGLPPLIPVLPEPPMPVFPPVVLMFPDCAECDPILQAIKAMEKELAEMAKDLDELSAEFADARMWVGFWELALKQAEAQLEAFNNPPSSASADGQTINSNDLEVTRFHNRDLWDQYRNGDLTAQELEQRWNEGISDAERQQLKDDFKKDLEREVNTSKKGLENAKKRFETAERMLNEVKQATDEMLKELEAKQKEYDECIKRCMETPVIIGGIDLEYDDTPPIFSDGFESGDTSSWTTGNYDERDFNSSSQSSASSEDDEDPEMMTLTFNDDPIMITGYGFNEYTLGELIERSDQKNDISYGADEQGNFRIEGNIDMNTTEPTQQSSQSSSSSPKDDDAGFWCGTLGWFCDDDAEDQDVEDKQVSSSSSSESSEDQIGLSEDDDAGFWCGRFGWFCGEKDAGEQLDLYLANLSTCTEEENYDSCSQLDKNNDGKVVEDEILGYQPALLAPGDYYLPVNINGLDDNPDYSLGDLQEFGNCLGGNLSSCDGLDFDQTQIQDGSGNDRLVGGDFKPALINGSDLILGDPISDDVIGIGGRDIIGGPDTIIPNDDFFIPGTGPIGGNDILLGPPDGNDLIGGSPNDDRLLGDGSDDILQGGPDPLFNPQSGQLNNPPTTPQQLPEKIQQTIREIARRANLGPCEKLVVQVKRTQIGNKVKYTITVRRELKIGESCDDGNVCTLNDVCSPNGTCGGTELRPDDGDDCTDDYCDPNTGNIINQPIPGCYDDVEDDSWCSSDADCDDGDECTIDVCDLEQRACSNIVDSDNPQCDNPVETSCTKDGGYDSDSECQHNCSIFNDCVYDGEACYMCVEPEDKPKNACEDSATTPFISKEECESLSSLCPSGTHECKSFNVGRFITNQCWGCIPKALEKQCPSGQYKTSQEAQKNCVIGSKPTQDPETECWSCPSIDEVGEDSCDHGESEYLVCENECNGECVKVGPSSPNGSFDCYECRIKEEEETPPELCDAPTMDLAECETTCEEIGEGECKSSYTRGDGRKCYECEEKKEEVVLPQCPSGKVADKSSCDSQCDGTCEADDNGCYSCVVYNCPANTHQNECPSSCSNGCDVVAEQGATTCFACKQSCEELCESNGFAQVGVDWSNYVESYIQEYSCVSGAAVSLQTATIGSCTCSNQPSVSIDQTAPVCAGTTCGDVACGSTVSCPVDENTTATVSCNWGGWKKVDVNKFQPVVGN